MWDSGGTLNADGLRCPSKTARSRLRPLSIPRSGDTYPATTPMPVTARGTQIQTGVRHSGI